MLNARVDGGPFLVKRSNTTHLELAVAKHRRITEARQRLELYLPRRCDELEATATMMSAFRVFGES